MTTTKTTKKTNPEVELHEEISKFYADPYGFVVFSFPWGEKGTELEQEEGPDVWQKEVLQEIGRKVAANNFNGKDPVKAIREAVASGHGIGKSALVAWLVSWLMSTRPFCQGTITANTSPQLESKTWAQVAKWARLCITSHWFTVNSGKGHMKMYHNQYKDSWFCTAQTCREENSESFAGQHATTSSSWYIFDEASAIPEKIWEVAEGGLTDGEPMFFAFGNPTKNTGKFHRITFGSEKHRWSPRSIDSRNCKLTNKAQLKEWEEDWGEDSDFFRVRVKGLPPSSSEMQFIGRDLVYGAQKRDLQTNLQDPLIMGVDVARGGGDNFVMRFRRGMDAKTIPPIKIPGSKVKNSMTVSTKICEILANGIMGFKVDMCFIDATGDSSGGAIADRVHQLGFDNIQEIQFGAGSPEKGYANMRAYMWAKKKEWLQYGMIDSDMELEGDLVGPEYTHNRRDEILLEPKDLMKKRGLRSPDDGDALALTFARPVAVKQIADIIHGNNGHQSDHNPFEDF